MSFRAWLSVTTLFLIAVIVFFSRHELLRALELLRHVDVWILFLLLPGQLLVYYAGGEMMFSYLRAKKSIEAVKPLTLARMSLEMNFVNHVLPSGGVSGISYMSWRLGKYGVMSSRATMAQVVRYTMSFASFIFLLSIAVFIVTLDGNINRWIILVSSTLVGGMIGITLAGIYLLSSRERMKNFSQWLSRVVNRIVAKVTLHKIMHVIDSQAIEKYFSEMHTDFTALRNDKKILLRPFLWGIVFNTADVSLFLITFWALGHPVNPAPILIAYGVAAIAGFVVVTPGGAGAYEAIMVTFLSVAGLEQGTAIAGILLTRVILLIGTIGFGYLFYQHALVHYGKDKPAPL
jgi:uncharacterized protein (TIRG00374 family)